MMPSTNAPGGVVKITNVKVPPGIPAGHVRPKLATAVGGKNAGITLLAKRGAKLCGEAVM